MAKDEGGRVPEKFRVSAQAGGRTYELDARRARDVEYLRLVGEVQAAEAAGSPSVGAVMALYDHVLGPVAAQVEADVAEDAGYADYGAWVAACNQLVEAVAPKA